MSALNKDKKRKQNNALETTVGHANAELVERFGDASSEFIVAKRGYNNATGQVLERGHDKISTYSNPDGKHTGQQAGFSAEVASTARKNSEFKKTGSNRRVARSEDARMGSNHPVFDHVELDADGLVVEGSGSQMKFVATLPKNEGDRLAKIDSQISRITRVNGKQKRYLGHKLEVPSDQVETYKAQCHEQARKLRQQAEGAKRAGKADVVEKKLQEAENCEQLAQDIEDSGLTTQEAIEYRRNAAKATAKDIARNSHEAGIKGAKTGALIAVAVGSIVNTYQVMAGEKDAGQAVKEVGFATAASAATGYVSAAAGSALSATMQQSGKEAIRALAKSSIPSLIVTTTLTVSKSAKALVAGEIDGTQFLNDIGEHGSGLLASSMMAALGQIAIPIPVVGALVGSMIGYSLSSVFYNELVDSLNIAKASEARYVQIKQQCEEARQALDAYHEELQHVLAEHFAMLEEEAHNLISNLDEALDSGDSSQLGLVVNAYAKSKGTELDFDNTEQLMDSISNRQSITI